MSNHVMTVDFLGQVIKANTSDNTVCLNDLFNAGNSYRLSTGQAALQMPSFLKSKTVEDYLQAASLEWNVPVESFIRREGKGNNTRTYVHLSLAVLAAESLSPRFHAYVHKTFIEGKLLEYRELGGTEFKKLNAYIDLYLPEREGRDNKGIFINVAKLIRNKVLGEDKTTEDWNSATAAATHCRYEYENTLCTLLKLNVVKNYDHLKELINAL